MDFMFWTWYLHTYCFSEQKMPEGSWKCEKCNNINYPFRTKCNRQNCGAEKPAESKKSPSPAADENDQVCYVILLICIPACCLRLFFSSITFVHHTNLMGIIDMDVSATANPSSSLSLLAIPLIFFYCVYVAMYFINCQFFLPLCNHWFAIVYCSSEY